MNITVTKFSKAWQVRKQAMRRTVDEFVVKSRVLESLGFHDLGDEIRTVLTFKTRTLVQDTNGNVIERGPVIAGIRYHERFLSEAAHPAEIVTILEPFPIFAPNIARTGALCLGHPSAGVQLAEILHMTWAAIVFNLRVVDTIEWHGFQPDAALFVRCNPHRFPLTAARPEEQP